MMVCASQKTCLTNGRVANWAPVVVYRPLPCAFPSSTDVRVLLLNHPSDEENLFKNQDFFYMYLVIIPLFSQPLCLTKHWYSALFCEISGENVPYELTHSMRTHDKWKDETQIAKPFETDDNFFEWIARAVRTAYEQHTNGYRFKNGKP